MSVKRKIDRLDTVLLYTSGDDGSDPLFTVCLVLPISLISSLPELYLHNSVVSKPADETIWDSDPQSERRCEPGVEKPCF
jgi:hypothetical protein